MNKLTAEQILEIVSENYSEENFAFNEWGELSSNSKISLEKPLWKDNKENWGEVYKNYKQDVLNELGLGKVVEVDQYGGEGKGDEWYSVKHFIDHDVYIRIDGFYSSGNGTDFYDGYGVEVTPQEKVITVYE